MHARSQASPSRSPPGQSVLRQAGGHGTAFGAAAGAGTCLSIVPPPITHQSTNRQTPNRQTSNQSTANARARKQKWKQGKGRYSGRPRHAGTQNLALPESISWLAQLFRFVSSTRACQSQAINGWVWGLLRGKNLVRPSCMKADTYCLTDGPTTLSRVRLKQTTPDRPVLPSPDRTRPG